MNAPEHIHNERSDKFIFEDGLTVEITGLRRTAWNALEGLVRVTAGKGLLASDRIDLSKNAERVRLAQQAAARNGANPVMYEDTLLAVFEKLSTPDTGAREFKPTTFAEMVAADIHEHPSLADGLFPVGGITTVAGRPDQGKSNCVMDLLIAHAAGQKWLGHFDVGQGRSAYLDMEMPKDGFTLRVKAQAAHRNVSDIPFSRFTGEDFTDRLDSDAGRDALIELITKHQLTLLAIDPVGDIMGAADENEATGVRQVYTRLVEAAHWTGCTQVLVDHRRKAGLLKTSPLDEVRGSSVKVAKSDSLIVVQLSGDTTKVEQVRHKWGPRHAPFTFKLLPVAPDQVPVYAGDSDSGAAEQAERAQSAILDLLETGPQKRKHIVTTVAAETSTSTRTVDSALRDLLDDTAITRLDRPGREAWYALADDPEALAQQPKMEGA